MSERPRTSPAAALLELLRARHATLDALEAVASRQAGLVEARDAEGLAALVADRRAAVDALRAGEATLAAAIEALGAAEVATGERELVRESLSSLQRRLEAIGALDAKAADVLRERRDAVGRELASAGAARRARGAYAGGGRGPASEARFADRKA